MLFKSTGITFGTTIANIVWLKEMGTFFFLIGAAEGRTFSACSTMLPFTTAAFYAEISGMLTVRSVLTIIKGTVWCTYPLENDMTSDLFRNSGIILTYASSNRTKT